MSMAGFEILETINISLRILIIFFFRNLEACPYIKILHKILEQGQCFMQLCSDPAEPMSIYIPECTVQGEEKSLSSSYHESFHISFRHKLLAAA